MSPTVVASLMVVVVALLTILAIVLLLGRAAEAASCAGVQIKPGNDLDTIVNRDPRDRATTFCVQAGNYSVDRSVVLGPGDKLLGPAGQVVTRGPASYGVPTVKINGRSSIEKLVQLNGSNRLAWLDISGGEITIAAGQSNASTRLEYIAVHGATRTGISNMRGKLLHSNVYNSGTDSRWWGHSAAAVKGIEEYEAAFNYIHDNPANGLWCDHGCKEAGSAMPNGFWAHDNLVVKNGRWGVRYEYSPRIASDGKPTALIERNEIHANGWQGSGYGGASMWDAQNATFRSNDFGAEAIGGVSYGANGGRRAILFNDSGKASRTNLYNGDAVSNSLGGERIDGCTRPDSIVFCSANI